MSPPAICCGITPSFAITFPPQPPFRCPLPAEAANPHLDAVQVGQALDLGAEPAAHLAAGVAARHGVDLVLLVEVVQERDRPALVLPGVLHPTVEAERQRRAEGE